MNLNLTLLFQVLFFAAFVWFSKKYVWTPIIGALNERKTRIADGLVAAEQGQLAEQRGQQQAEKIIAEAKIQAGKIISKAEKHGGELVTTAKTTARHEGERMLNAAQTEITTEVNKAKQVLRAEVGELALAGAEKILQREVDAKTHAELLDSLAARL